MKALNINVPVLFIANNNNLQIDRLDLEPTQNYIYDLASFIQSFGHRVDNLYYTTRRFDTCLEVVVFKSFVGPDATENAKRKVYVARLTKDSVELFWHSHSCSSKNKSIGCENPNVRKFTGFNIHDSETNPKNHNCMFRGFYNLVRVESNFEEGCYRLYYTELNQLCQRYFVVKVTDSLILDLSRTEQVCEDGRVAKINLVDVRKVTFRR